ncbi:MAG: 30S ribosomal protein S13 [Candidatus Woesearchaeota archaeon]|nr:30S ribosomal protein S13 [Candidatus Woesearchaeota archaeon]
MAKRYIIRVANTDLNGEKNIVFALRKVTGVGTMFANALCYAAGIDPNAKAGDISEAEEKQLNELIKQPKIGGIPEWMLNRQKDPETGETSHLSAADVKFFRENDIKQMRKIKSYKGQRHAVGLPVRGQRTKSNFRKHRKKQVSKKVRV